ncbi:MAG: tetratricopeptide repeat protein, partial [Desulfobacterales bacterium]
QDNISKEVLTALRVKLLEGEQARVWAKGTNNLDAYITFLKAYDQFRSFTKNDLIQTRKFCQEAISLDSNYEHPYSLIGVSHVIDLWFGWGESPAASMEKAEAALKKALVLNPLSDFALANLNHLLLMQKRFDDAVAAGEKSIALNPNGDLNMVLLGITFNYVRRYEEAITLFKEANRRNPYGPAWYIHNMGNSYRGLGRWDEAIAEYQRALDRNPDHFPALAAMALAYGMAGRRDEGRAVVAEILKINPQYSIENTASWFYKYKTDLEAIKDAFRKVGLPEHPPLELPDKPSIAVLPFVNISGDPEQEYFSDGLTEQIITTLSKSSALFVISRTSTFTYKGKSVKVQQVSQDLGVRYVLEGSVQKAGEQIRITAQLVDATMGQHLWAEHYERDLGDIFVLQDELTMKITKSLAIELTEGEKLRMRSGGTNNIKAAEKLIESTGYLRAMNKESNAVARQLAQESIALDPRFALAYSNLATTHVMDVWLGSSKSPGTSYEKAIKLLQKSIALDENLELPHALLGHIYGLQRKYEQAIAEGERAIALNPNSDTALVFLAMTLDWVGRSEEAITMYKKAMRLCPFSPGYYYLNLGHAYRSLDRCEDAIQEYKETLDLTPRNVAAHTALVICYSLLGRYEEARTAAAEALEIDPKLSLMQSAKRHPYKNQDLTARFLEALRKADLP